MVDVLVISFLREMATGVSIASTTILLCICYYKLVSGFFSNVVMHRLTKASFNLKIGDIADIWLSYFIGIICYLYIAFNHIMFKNILPFQLDFGTIVPNEAIIFVGFSLLYLGRIISKFQGVFYGRLHFSASFIPTTLLMFAYAIIVVINSIKNLNAGSSKTVYICVEIFINLFQCFRDGIYNYLGYFGDFAVCSILGTLFLATIGELLLSGFGSRSRTLLAASEKLPSDFKTLTGVSCDIVDKIYEIFEGKEVKSIKCATRSLRLLSDIEEYIYKQYKDMHGEDGIEVDYRLLKAPEETALGYYTNAIMSLQPSLGDIVRKRKKAIEDFKNTYSKNLEKLETLGKSQMLNYRDYNFSESVFLITEYTNGAKNLLIVAKDTSPRMSRVGLYTEEPYIIDTFANAFDYAWKNSEKKMHKW